MNKSIRFEWNATQIDKKTQMQIEKSDIIFIRVNASTHISVSKIDFALKIVKKRLTLKYIMQIKKLMRIYNPKKLCRLKAREYIKCAKSKSFNVVLLVKICAKCWKKPNIKTPPTMMAYISVKTMTVIQKKKFSTKWKIQLLSSVFKIFDRRTIYLCIM